MEKLIKSRSEVKQYAVYAHYYEDQLFYIGSGIYHRDNISKSRAYDFISRSPDWFNYCDGETEKIEVELLFQTNDRKLAFDKEEEITRYYMELEVHLINVDIGNKRSEEWIKKHASGENNPMWGKRGKETPMYGKRGKDCHNYGKKHTKEAKQRMSESRKGKMSGKNNPMYGKTAGNAKKVLVTNNLTSESKVFDSIKDAHEFISQNGFDKTQSTLQYHLNKGPYNFKNYTMEVAKDMVSE